MGVQYVEKIRQSILIATRRQMHRLAAGGHGAIKLREIILLGRVITHGVVHIRHRRQNTLAIIEYRFLSSIVGDLDGRIKLPEIQERPIKRRADRP